MIPLGCCAATTTGDAMKRTLALAALSAAAMLVVPASAGAATTVLRTTWLNYSFQFVDHPPLQSAPNQPPSPGDVALIKSKYWVGKRVVAYERTSCTVVDWPHASCDINIAAPSGQLILQGQFNPISRATQRVAIVGGTGIFRNARGEVAFKQTADNKGTAVFTIIQ
jgi:hypothetical protein